MNISIPEKSRIQSIALVLAASCLFSQAAPDGEPPGGRARVSVRKARPRLLVPERMLPDVARRARGPLRRIYREQVRRACDQGWDEKKVSYTISNASALEARLLALLTCWRIEKVERHRLQALALVRAALADGSEGERQLEHSKLQTISIAYDWLHETLSTEDKALIQGGLGKLLAKMESNEEREFVSGYSHLNTASAVIARLALWEGSEADTAALASTLERWEKYLDVTRHVASDGGHHLGWRYGRSYATRVVFVTEALTTATETDFFLRERAWLSQIGYHGVYGLRPDDTYFRVGDTHREIDLNLDEDLVFYGILASRYRDPHLAWFARHTIDWCRGSRGLASPAQYVLAVLFHDPELAAIPPHDLPRVRAFRNAGNYVFRTGWAPDDTAVLLRAMPWYHLNHERRDFGSFAIYHRGGLAIHGGAYKTGDEASEYAGSHHSNYARRTIAHNTITVHDPAERFCNPFIMGPSRCKGENLWSNDGGQHLRTTRDDGVPSAQPRNVTEIRDPSFAQGSVPVFEDHPGFAYVVADGTKAYRSEKVSLFLRHFIYLKDVEGWKHPVIVVLDRVVSKDPSFRKTWNLHTVEVPRLEGNTFIIENRTRIRFSGESTARPFDRWYEYSGKLYSETLLPRDARMEFVGGEGKEFWVDGRNYPAEIREVDRIIEPGIGRIEVSPRGPSASDVFLHVLSPTTCEDATPRPAALLLESKGSIALKVANHALSLGDPSGADEARTYAVASGGPLVHVVSGLRPGSLQAISRDGSVIEEKEASAAGILTFSSPSGGRFRIAPAARPGGTQRPR